MFCSSACLTSLNTNADPLNIPEKIEIVGNTLPPFGYLKNDTLSGFSLELLEEVLANSHLQNTTLVTKHVSFARAMSQLQTRTHTIALHFARSPERETQFKWLGPYFDINMGLIGLSSDAATYSDFDGIKDKRIAVIRDTLLQEILLKRGVNEDNMLLISDPVSGLKILNAGRVDFFAHIPEVLEYLMHSELNISPPTIEEKFTLQTGAFYFALSLDFEDELVAHLQAVLDSMRDDDEFAYLHLRHRLENRTRENISIKVPSEY